MNRNVDDHFAKTPTPHFPRSRFDMGIKKRLQTQAHGRLFPFFCRVAYPGDTWQMDMSVFCRMDTSYRVPLDDIYLDTYFFFVPFRIIDKNFKAVLGELEPYDDISNYGMPVLNIPGYDGLTYDFNTNCILSYLGYNQNQVDFSSGSSSIFSYHNADTICPYPLWAYWKVYNDWFRDENLDASIPVEDYYGSFSSWASGMMTLIDSFQALKVNRFHDYFSSALISPQKGPEVTIPLATSAPIGFVAPVTGSITSSSLTPTIGDSVTDDTWYSNKRALTIGGNNYTADMVADLSKASGSINELRLAFALQSLYERRGRFGTRYIETIRGQWGIEVPDSFLQRPEYLGGSRVTLNNVPVLSTENSSQLGQMAGNSATLSGGNSWTKTFVEYGLILGVSCTRVKHSYCQGVRTEIFDMQTSLDLYNPVFANIGYTGIKIKELYNDPSGSPNDVFAYQEAWANLRSDYDSFAGLFGAASTNTELKNKWHYGDYYASAPSFSASWMKEDIQNVARTLTGQLIAGATGEGAQHQFMMGYYYHPIVTRILPSHSVPVELIGRL